ncbi:MAG: methylated-DNA--[protein]-cysteine S-methyltransferase, partial [Gammaproteobacteria bacterium]|nr:methylated-DNA--[protein]-cysteine S-methyltransferase [Gammaproteobacteria bacterium]NIR96427.1 methylated-DNA--[protein]-cysteine S-methyltransferase [Gammaproteobacteria bacterium]NIW50450.1 hypothetical protein [Gammaproteobacteria bacterium]NIX02327.1 hypothetical protein [Phycisphaerae bacterium]
GVTGLTLNARSNPSLPLDEMGERILQQILAYFESPYRVSFTVPLKPVGTIFQQRVWRQMSKIPPGQVQTYGELAT